MIYPSKRNKVYQKNGNVVKCHSCHRKLKREAAALTALYNAGLAVPRLLECSRRTLLLEYVEGTTYADLSESITYREASALAHWLADYHSITNRLRGDVNLRNFLWTGRRCVGVDFEDPPAVGEREEDQGKIIAFAVTYDPIFSANKIKCGELLLHAFLQTGGDQNKIRNAYLREILALKARRNQAPFEIQRAASFFAEIEGRLLL